MRKKQRLKNFSKEDMRVKIQELRTLFREQLVCTGKDDNYDIRWGRFHPEMRINVDHSPCPFVFFFLLKKLLFSFPMANHVNHCNLAILTQRLLEAL